MQRSFNVRIRVMVRVWIRNQGAKAVKVISCDCSLASELVKAALPTAPPGCIIIIFIQSINGMIHSK